MKKTFFKAKRIFVYPPNEHAFTLVEMLFSLSIFMLIIFFISPLLQIIFNQKELPERLQSMQWEVFYSQIKKEIRMSTKAEVAGSSLVLTEDAGIVVFEKYENSLRRRVNYSGHEILLQNVSEASFTIVKNKVQITVKDENGKVYWGEIYPFLDWNEPI